MENIESDELYAKYKAETGGSEHAADFKKYVSRLFNVSDVKTREGHVYKDLAWRYVYLNFKIVTEYLS